MAGQLFAVGWMSYWPVLQGRSLVVYHDGYGLDSPSCNTLLYLWVPSTTHHPWHISIIKLLIFNGTSLDFFPCTWLRVLVAVHILSLRLHAFHLCFAILFLTPLPLSLPSKILPRPSPTIMTVQNPNRGGGDDDSDDAPQVRETTPTPWESVQIDQAQRYEPWHYNSATAPHQMVDLQDFDVSPFEAPTLNPTMITLLAVQGYTVIPPGPSLQRHNRVPAVGLEEEPPFPHSLLSLLPPDLRIHESLAAALQPLDTALLRKTHANILAASNGGAGNTKSKSKKTSTGKKKKQDQKVCPLFQESGQCRYGDDCKFSHLLPDTLPPPDATAGPEPRKKEQDSPMDVLFAKYPEFDYMPNKPLWGEFDRLGQHFKWPGPRRDQVKKEFRDALVGEFNHVYGMDENNLESWVKLCQAMGLSAPKTLKEAHKVRKLVWLITIHNTDQRQNIRGAYVNLVVLVQSPRTGEPVEVFKSAQDLRQFTANSKWAFPQQHTQAGGLLNMLLRKMSGPSHGHRARGKKETWAK